MFSRRRLVGYVVSAMVLCSMSGCSSCGKEPDDLGPAPANSVPTADTEHASNRHKRGLPDPGAGGWGTIHLGDAGGSRPQ